MFVNIQGPWSPLFGRLSLAAIPYDNPIILATFAVVALLALVIVGAVFYFGKLGYLWKEWLTTVDHKKVGVMYIILGLVMLLRGFFDGAMIRTQQVMADGPNSPGVMGAQHGYLPPYHFDQIYTAHGTIMLLFAATPLVSGLGNLIVPLQIGARDMAFPYLNAVSLWLTMAGAALVMISLFVGEFSSATWVGLMPFSEMPYNPGVGVDYWMWAFQISSVATTFNSINMIATIVKMRAPGMTWLRMPFFCWATLSTNIIGLTAFPLLTVALTLLGLDRYFGTHFFSAGYGGNMMLYVNLFWLWGHPEVYFLMLPAFGIMSEVIPTFSEKPLFGYVTMVAASFSIAGIGWAVWAHHFFTMGMGPELNAYFSGATMLVGIPTGVKAFNWIFTMYRGRLTFTTPMLWALCGLVLLLLGGLTGMMLAVPAINYSVHDSIFVVAHFHLMVLVIGSAMFAGVTYWWPKLFGFKLDEHNGQWFFWTFVVASLLVFVPLFGLGFMGETRRLDYLYDPNLEPLLLIAEGGILMYFVSIFFFLKMLYVSLRDQIPAEADAWGTGRTLEWVTHTPVPFYNYAVTPQIHSREELAWRRDQGIESIQPKEYVPIHLPGNTAVPIIIGALAMVAGFGLTWRIWWMMDVSLLGIIAAIILRAFDKNTGYVLSAAEIAQFEKNNGSASMVTEQPVRLAPVALEIH